jgi:4-hydroxy-tetrahydrodipicolinate synthase
MKYGRSGAKKWIRDNLRGYLVTTTTALTSDYEIDVRGTKDNVEKFLALPGVQGLYIGSLYQEFWTLTLEERKKLADIMIEQVAGRAPVLVNITENSYKNAIELAKSAQASGADLVMCWPPFYGPRNNEGVLGFYKRLADAVDIGIATYTTTLHELGFYVDVELMLKLAEIDTIVAAKEASLSLARYSAMMEAVGHLLPISAPLEEYYLFGKIAYPDVAPSFVLGSSRPVYMQSQEKPYCAEFFDATERGDIEAARVAMGKILRVANELHSRFLSKGQHHATLLKYIASLLGFAAGPVRPPLTMPSQDEQELAIRVLRENGLLPDAAHQVAAQ